MNPEDRNHIVHDLLWQYLGKRQQKEVAAASECSAQFLNDVLKGRRYPSAGTAMRILDALGIEPGPHRDTIVDCWSYRAVWDCVRMP